MEILKINQRNSSKIIEKTLAFLKRGKVVVFPTDTVYGLICDAGNKKAIEMVFKIKKRDFQKPVSVFVKNFKAVEEIACIDKNQEKLSKKVWPGKAIIILKAKRKFPRGIVCQLGKIGLRIPKYPLLNKILSGFNGPLAQTSANISGQPASNEIGNVLKQFRSRKYQPDLVIDAGNLKKARPSKVIDLTIWPPKILRF